MDVLPDPGDNKEQYKTKANTPAGVLGNELLVPKAPILLWVFPAEPI